MSGTKNGLLDSNILIYRSKGMLDFKVIAKRYDNLFVSAITFMETLGFQFTDPVEKAKIAPQLIFNLHLDAYLTLFFVVLLWLIVLDMLRVAVRHVMGKPVLPLTETPHSPSLLEAEWVRD